MHTDNKSLSKRVALHALLTAALFYAAYLLCLVYPHWPTGIVVLLAGLGCLLVILDGDHSQAMRRKRLLKDLYDEQPCRLTDEERELIAELIEGKNH